MQRGRADDHSVSVGIKPIARVKVDVGEMHRHAGFAQVLLDGLFWVGGECEHTQIQLGNGKSFKVAIGPQNEERPP